jgi:hypothetical protein
MAASMHRFGGRQLARHSPPSLHDVSLSIVAW